MLIGSWALVDPFTLYGTACKRFVIDKLDGDKEGRRMELDSELQLGERTFYR